MEEKFSWLFHGIGGSFASGVFETKDLAEEWIKENSLYGTLTKYPVNKGIYNQAIEKGYFTITKEYQVEGGFIQKFTSASQEHYHYECGFKD